MIILGLYIYSLRENTVLKNYSFNKFGVNVILGEKRESGEQTSEDTEEGVNNEANGAGKTTMIECLRFLLGSSLPSVFTNRPLLVEHDIFLVLEVESNGNTVFLGRMMNNTDYCFYRRSEVINWDLKTWEPLNENGYGKYVEEFLIGINKNDDTPSFAQLREYLIRDEKKGFGDIVISDRQAIQNYRILAFLCGFPYNSEKEIAVHKKLQREKNDVLKQIKLMSDDITELKIKEKKLKFDIDKTSNIIENLNITEKIEESIYSYNENKARLSKIQKKIFEYENIITQYKKNIDNLEEKIKEIKQIKHIEPFYKEIMGHFPNNIKRNYDEITNFYDFMVENRGKYFKSKIENLNVEMRRLVNERNEIRGVLEQKSKIIKSQDLLTDLTNITEELRAKNEELGKIKYKIDLYNQKKTINNEINKIKQDIISLTGKKYDEFKVYDEVAISLQQTFEELMNQAYREAGFLEFEFDNRTGLNETTGRIKIKCHIEDEDSHGRLYMKINMFDLAWFMCNMASEIGFLCHDGSYCKPDKDAKFKLLKYVDNELSKNQAGQYFITANIDEFKPKAIEYFRVNKRVVAELDKQDDHRNRFFGFKF